jgi:hypothetical protein
LHGALSDGVTAASLHETFLTRLLKRCVSGRDPALRGFLSALILARMLRFPKMLRAWVDGPNRAFHNPV